MPAPFPTADITVIYEAFQAKCDIFDISQSIDFLPSQAGHRFFEKKFFSCVGLSSLLLLLLILVAFIECLFPAGAVPRTPQV